MVTNGYESLVVAPEVFVSEFFILDHLRQLFVAEIFVDVGAVGLIEPPKVLAHLTTVVGCHDGKRKVKVNDNRNREMPISHTELSILITHFI